MNASGFGAAFVVYSNENPQLDAVINDVHTSKPANATGPAPARPAAPGPTWSPIGEQLTQNSVPFCSPPPSKRRRRLTDSDRQAIKTAYAHGIRQQTLADRHGVSLSTIKPHLRADKRLSA